MNLRKHVVGFIVSMALLGFVCQASASSDSAIVAFVVGGWSHHEDDAIVLGDAGSLPPHVQTSVNAFNAAFDDVVGDAAQASSFEMTTSPDGRTIVASSASFGASAPTGVWIWPDWQNENDFIHFSEFSSAVFLSNNHVAIVQHENGVRVVDIREPETKHSMEGFQLFGAAAVADSGRWASVDTDGVLHIGSFDLGDQSDPVEIDSELVEPGTVNWLRWVHDDAILVIALRGGTIKTFHVAESNEVSAADALDGARMPRDQLLGTHPVAGGDSMFGFAPLEPNGELDAVFFTLSPDGTIAAEPIELPNKHPHYPSPCGKYVVAASGPLEVLLHVIPTPKADPNAPLPGLPDILPLDASGAYAVGFQGKIGWLSWE